MYNTDIDNELAEETPLLKKLFNKARSIEKLSIKGSALLHFLIIFFGISAWLGVNSTYIQLPLLVANAPEQWSLPSFMVIVIQIGNIGPLLYTVFQKWTRFKDSSLIAKILFLGLIASILFAFVYNQTAFFLRKERSIALLILVFVFALVGCLSSVLFLPYIGKFKGIYLVTYFIGEGLSGLVPSIVALGQGVGGDPICIASNTSSTGYTIYNPPPKFGVETYFGFISCLFFISFISFLLLDLLPTFKDERAREAKEQQKFVEISNDQPFKHNPNKISTFNYTYLLILLGIICTFANGLSPSIQSYSCLPYGNVAYHLTVTLTSIVNPTACFAAYFIPHKSIRMITTLAILSVIFTIYVFVTALVFPTPLQGTSIGAVLVVISWVSLVGLQSFIRLAITSIFREQAGRSLLWIGSVTQIGSFIGSLLAFFLINFSTIFRQIDPCSST
uniref:Riboflavin transporter n=1 Tax=Culicoides sonorensis TaxID=179676 RepID=A0A336L4W2_CULSO